MDEQTAAPDRKRVHATVAALTHPGQRRVENQDNFLIGDLSGRSNGVLLRPPSDDTTSAVTASLSIGKRGTLLLVADGMGGAAAGRLASGLACSFVLAELHEGWACDGLNSPLRFAFRLREAVEKANRRIHDHALRNPECTGMGTTATVAGILDGFVYVAQVGDSRAYLVRGNSVTQLTRDQSLVQQWVDAGVMTEEEAERSTHGNVILQAVGVQPEVSVDITFQELRRDDQLVLCSDGLHRVVSPEEVVEVIRRLHVPDTTCEELVGLANARGGPDNVTVLVAHMAGPGLSTPEPWDAVARTPLDLPRQQSAETMP